MASSSNSRGSTRGRVGRDHTPQCGNILGLDILADYDTSYPDLRDKVRKFPGNGKTPGNPFGSEFPNPLPRGK
jgi:hypothetical protein